MRSLATIFSLAALALAGLTAATPIHPSSLPLPLNLSPPKSAPTVHYPLPRTDAPRGVQEILTSIQTQIAPLADQIKYATKQNATATALTPPVHALAAVLTNAVPELQKLVGQPAGVVLASANATAEVTAQELAELVADIMDVTFDSLYAVFGLLGGDISALQPLLDSLSDATVALVQVTLDATEGVTEGLLEITADLVQGLGSVVQDLNLGGVLSVIGL